MIKRTLKNIENWLPRFALILVLLEPIISWLTVAMQSKEFVLKNPYTSWDFHLILIFCILNVIYSQMISEKISMGDESNILLNRNQSDYYEIWEACKKVGVYRLMRMDIHLKHLWFNFIQKFS